MPSAVRSAISGLKLDEDNKDIMMKADAAYMTMLTPQGQVGRVAAVTTGATDASGSSPQVLVSGQWQPVHQTPPTPTTTTQSPAAAHQADVNSMVQAAVNAVMFRSGGRGGRFRGGQRYNYNYRGNKV